MKEDDLTQRLDDWAATRRIPPARDSNCQCGVTNPVCSATYVGPSYSTSKVRILFVGLDHGKDTESYDARDSRKWFLETYRGPSRKGWRFGGNKHLFGCVQVAAEILNLDCR